VNLNDPAPDFALHDLENGLHRLSDHRGKIVIVNFWSAECPHSDRTDRALLAGLHRWAGAVTLLPIASNRNETAELLRAAARARGLPVVLLDADHAVADLFDAQTTPQIFLIDAAGILRYRGAVDDITFGRHTATRSYLDEAVQSVLEGRDPALAETRAFGCSITREI